MGILEKIPRQGSIAVKQLTADLELPRIQGSITVQELGPTVQNTEEILSM